MAKKKTAKAKKPAISEEKRSLLAQRGTAVKAFPTANLPPAPEGFAERTIERARAEGLAEGTAPKPPPKPKPKRKEDFQLTVRISEELATELRNASWTAREAQADTVKRALETELTIMRDKLGKFLTAPPPKNTRA